MQQQTSDAKESTLIQRQQKIIEEFLDESVSAMKGELTVVTNVNTIYQQLDEADQHSWRSCMIVTGLQKPGKDKMNNEDSKRVITAIAREAGLDKGKFTKHVDKVHPVGNKKWQAIKNYQIHHPQF